MGTDVEGAILTIVTYARAPKALGESRSGVTRDGNIEEVSRSGDDRMIVSELHDERTIDSHSIFIKAIFGVNSGKRGGSVGRSWRRQFYEQGRSGRGRSRDWDWRRRSVWWEF